MKDLLSADTIVSALIYVYGIYTILMLLFIDIKPVYCLLPDLELPLNVPFRITVIIAFYIFPRPFTILLQSKQKLLPENIDRARYSN